MLLLITEERKTEIEWVKIIAEEYVEGVVLCGKEWEEKEKEVRGEEGMKAVLTLTVTLETVPAFRHSAYGPTHLMLTYQCVILYVFVI